jgi:inward rectifier potassium channel
LAKAPKRKSFRRSDKTQVVVIGLREVETHGLPQSFWTDLYHHSMTVYWPVFFATAAAIFIALNALFAFFYWLGNDPIANVFGNGPLGLFYFSIETLATVGYGDMHPQTNYGHAVATRASRR